MFHTIYTPPVSESGSESFTLWMQLNPKNYIAAPDPTPTVLDAVIEAAGGRKQPEDPIDEAVAEADAELGEEEAQVDENQESEENQ